METFSCRWNSRIPHSVGSHRSPFCVDLAVCFSPKTRDTVRARWTVPASETRRDLNGDGRRKGHDVGLVSPTTRKRRYLPLKYLNGGRRFVFISTTAKTGRSVSIDSSAMSVTKRPPSYNAAVKRLVRIFLAFLPSTLSKTHRFAEEPPPPLRTVWWLLCFRHVLTGQRNCDGTGNAINWIRVGF